MEVVLQTGMKEPNIIITRQNMDKNFFKKWKNAGPGDVQDFSLMKGYDAAGPREHLSRAASFTFGSGAFHAGKENFANAFGFLTSHQKNSFLNRLLVPLGTAYMGFSASIDGNPDDFFGAAAGFAAGLTVARPSAEIGHAVGKTLRMGGMSRLVGWGAGAVAGLGVGAAAYVGTSAVMQSYKNNNFVQKAVMPINSDLMTTTGLQTNNTLTARQRALGRLSRSGLNDRGQLLGAESMILKGML